tara:strand:+ start:404 stop:982 length:579 start_codon:yes stop_codon:yes gene_type:complete
MSARYAVAKQPLIDGMRTFMLGNSKKVTLPMNKEAFLKNGLIEDGDPNTFTRRQVQQGLARCVKNVKSGNGHGPVGRVALPDGISKVASVRILEAKHPRPTGDPDSLLLACLAKYRKHIRKAAQAVAIEASVKAGTAWVAEEVVDADGNPRIFVDQVSAIKAWARSQNADWWKDPTTKANLLAEGAQRVSLS